MFENKLLSFGFTKYTNDIYTIGDFIRLNYIIGSQENYNEFLIYNIPILLSNIEINDEQFKAKILI